MPQNDQLILASESPRRRRLLASAGFTFTVIPSQIDEETIGHETPEDTVRRLAEAKAEAVTKKFPRCWIIGADTLVAIAGQILGKPDSVDAARQMLRQLSGAAHQVYTGFTLQHRHRRYRFSQSVCTTVTFKPLTPGEIEWYLATREPFDKAGGYAVQGKGAFMVKTIHGSYTNVVGLPMSEIIDALTVAGVAAHFPVRQAAF